MLLSCSFLRNFPRFSKELRNSQEGLLPDEKYSEKKLKNRGKNCHTCNKIILISGIFWLYLQNRSMKICLYWVFLTLKRLASSRRSCILVKTCSFELQFCLGICNLLVGIRFKGISYRNSRKSCGNYLKAYRK